MSEKMSLLTEDLFKSWRIFLIKGKSFELLSVTKSGLFKLLVLQISGISTSKFFVGERVKMFGVTKSTDGVLVPAPVLDNTVNITKVGSSSGATILPVPSGSGSSNAGNSGSVDNLVMFSPVDGDNLSSLIMKSMYSILD